MAYDYDEDLLAALEKELGPREAARLAEVCAGDATMLRGRCNMLKQQREQRVRSARFMAERRAREAAEEAEFLAWLEQQGVR